MGLPQIDKLREHYGQYRQVIMSHEKLDLLLRIIQQQHDLLMAIESGDGDRTETAYEALDKDVISFVVKDSS